MNTNKFAQLLLASIFIINGTKATCETALSHFQGYKCVNLEPIGQGVFAKVYLIEQDGVKYAMKESKISTGESGKTETEILKIIQDSKNVIRLVESFQDTLIEVQILEYAEKGSLTSFRTAEKALFSDNTFMLNTLNNIILGIGYIHDKGWIWVDTKPDNIVVKADNSIRLIDFGMSMPVDSSGNPAGTPVFLDPNFFDKKTVKYESAVDIYSYGVSVYTLALNKLPFFNLLTFHSDILHDRGFILPKGLSKSVALIIDGCMKFDTADRLKVLDIKVLIEKGLAEDKDVKLESNYWVSLKKPLDLNAPPGFFSANYYVFRKGFYYSMVVVVVVIAVLGVAYKGKRSETEHNLPMFNAA